MEELEIKKRVDARELNSLKVGGEIKYYFEANNEDDLLDIIKYSKENKKDLEIIGDGTNTIFADGLIDKIVVKIKIIGRHKTYDGNDFTNIIVGAGENWDKFVNWTVENDLAGIENLSGIPGSVGATPINNISAYGKNVGDEITNVRVYDRETEEFIEIPNDQCMFSYKNSIFKMNRRRFIITAVSFQLKKLNENEKTEIPTYKDIQMFFIEKMQKEATLKEIREAILKIRKENMPDYRQEPNCGSYFKNPIVSKEIGAELLAKFGNMPQYQMPDGNIKIFSGWLIEHAELKGYRHLNFKISEKNVLVVVNTGESCLSDLTEFENLIIEKVEKKFGIVLEREVNIIR